MSSLSVSFLLFSLRRSRVVSFSSPDRRRRRGLPSSSRKVKEISCSPPWIERRDICFYTKLGLCNAVVPRVCDAKWKYRRTSGCTLSCVSRILSRTQELQRSLRNIYGMSSHNHSLPPITLVALLTPRAHL